MRLPDGRGEGISQNISFRQGWMRANDIGLQNSPLPSRSTPHAFPSLWLKLIDDVNQRVVRHWAVSFHRPSPSMFVWWSVVFRRIYRQYERFINWLLKNEMGITNKKDKDNLQTSHVNETKPQKRAICQRRDWDEFERKTCRSTRDGVSDDMYATENRLRWTSILEVSKDRWKMWM